MGPSESWDPSSRVLLRASRVEHITNRKEDYRMSADQTSSPRPLGSLHAALKTGQLSRRHFVESAMALGMTAAGAAMIVNTTPIAAAAQDASPEASPAAASVVPAAGTEGQTRGAGGELKILLWQAPSHLSPHAATGDKDNLAAQPVLEPLMN